MPDLPRPTDAALAADLIALARRVRRLAPPSRHAPDRFTEEKDDLASALERLARKAWSAGSKPERAPRRLARTGAGQSRTIRVGGRRVVVQVRRAGFSLG